MIVLSRRVCLLYESESINDILYNLLILLIIQPLFSHLLLAYLLCLHLLSLTLGSCFTFHLDVPVLMGLRHRRVLELTHGGTTLFAGLWPGDDAGALDEVLACVESFHGRREDAVDMFDFLHFDKVGVVLA